MIKSHFFPQKDELWVVGYLFRAMFVGLLLPVGALFGVSVRGGGEQMPLISPKNRFLPNGAASALWRISAYQSECQTRR